MTTIAQRRVAGATALMILFYLLQVALFAPSAGAAVSSGSPVTGVCPQGDGWPAAHLTDADGQAASGVWGSVNLSKPGADGTELLTATVNEGYEIEVCVKQGSTYTIFTVTDDEDPQTVWSGDLSHWSWRLVAEPEGPQFGIGACDETTGLVPVSFTVEGGTEVSIDGVVASPEDNAFQPGDHEIDLAEGTYTWRLWSPINSGTQIDTGSFNVGKCEATTTTTTEGTTTTTEGTTTTTRGTTTTTQGTTTTTEATTTTTTQPTTTTTGATTTTEAAEVLGTTVTTEAAEVLGTTITTVPEVSAETLPFTGSESGDMAKLGLLAVLAGALMLFAVRGSKEEEAIGTDIGGWSSL